LVGLLGKLSSAGGEDPAPLAAGLRCLDCTLVYVSGIRYLGKRAHLFTHLFDLLTYKGAVNSGNPFEVRKLTVTLLIRLCKLEKSAFNLINRAAVNNARS
jgi:hypothetical protein